jgi:hypothetical protein
MSGLFFDNEIFPDRKDLKKIMNNNEIFYQDIVDQAKKIELDNVNFDSETFVPSSKIVQKQAVFLWVRVYAKNEMSLEPNTTVFFNYLPTQEKLETKFICFAKKGLDRDFQDEVVNYVDEDDRRVLCVMVEEDRINKNNENIPFLKTLFKLGRYYEVQVYSRLDLTLTTDKGDVIDYFDIDF